MLEKLVISDIGYFKENGYTKSNDTMAENLGCSRRAIINALNRITVRPNKFKSHKKPGLELIIDGGDDYHRCLKLNSAISALFENKKGAVSTPLERAEKFQIPTATEVEEYAASIGFQIDGKYFVNSYTAKGWMMGKSRMRDWKAAMRSWQSNEIERKKSSGREQTRTVGQAVGIDESHIR